MRSPLEVAGVKLAAPSVRAILKRKVAKVLPGRRFWSAALAAATLVTVSSGVTAIPANAVDTCTTGWQSDVLASGLGELENLEPDGQGGFYVSSVDRGIIYHVDAQSTVTTVVSGLDHPAGLRLDRGNLYFLTGNGSTPAGTGELKRLEVATGQVTTLLTGLVQPVGLLLLPDGDLLFSQLSIPGPPVGVSRYRPSTGEFTLGWSKTPRPYGLALSADGQAVYTEDELTSEIIRIPLDAPESNTVVATVADGVLPVLDDLDVTADEMIYVGGDFSHNIYQVDPTSGAACAIVTGLGGPPEQPLSPGPSAVRIAPDGSDSALYVTDFDGTVRRLRPPGGLRAKPSPRRGQDND